MAMVAGDDQYAQNLRELLNQAHFECGQKRQLPNEHRLEQSGGEHPQRNAIEKSARGADQRDLAHMATLIEERHVTDWHHEVTDERDSRKKIQIAGQHKDNDRQYEQSQTQQQNAQPGAGARARWSSDFGGFHQFTVTPDIARPAKGSNRVTSSFTTQP